MREQGDHGSASDPGETAGCNVASGRAVGLPTARIWTDSPTAFVDVKQTTRDVVDGDAAHNGDRVPPADSRYSQPGERMGMVRQVELGQSTLESLGRELRRAADEVQDEPAQ